MGNNFGILCVGKAGESCHSSPSMKDVSLEMKLTQFKLMSYLE